MAKSNKPIFWGLFAAGGTVTAFIIPVLIVLTLLAGIGHVPEALSYAQIGQFLSSWLGKLMVFGVIFLSLWHAAHRARVTVHDFGLRQDTLMAWLLYSMAAIGSVLTLVWLLQI